MAKWTRLGATVLLGVSTSSTVGFARTTVGNWIVFDEDNVCSMQSGLPDRTQVAFAVGKSDPTHTEFRLGHANWRSLDGQASVKVNLLINGARQLTKPVLTFSAPNATGIIIPFSTARARELFTQGATVTVIYRSTTLGIIHLNGSEAAFQAVSQCADVRLDPFATR